MTNHLLRAGALSCALLATTCLTAPAMAQYVAPPDLPIQDGNGVDLRRGTFNMSAEDLSVGSGSFPHRLSVVREYSSDVSYIGGFGQNAAHNFDMRVFRTTVGGVTTVNVVRGSATEAFTQTSAGVYSTTEASGSTLAGDFVGGQEYLNYTLRDGSVIRFNPTNSVNCNFNKRLCGRPTAWTFPSGARLDFTYFPTLYTIGTFPNIEVVTVPALWTVTNNFGYRLVFTNQKHFRLASPVIQSVSAYNLASSTSPIATVQYAYDSIEPVLVSITDTQSNTTTLGYSGTTLIDITPPGAGSPAVSIGYTSTLVSSVARAGVGTWNYSYTSTQTVVTDPLSHTTTLNFGSDPLPQWVEDGLSRRTEYEYDANNRVTKITAPEDNYIEYTYDARGNVTHTLRRDKAGNSANDIETSATYPSTCTNIVICNRPTSVTDANGNVTDYDWDTTHGGLLSVTLPAPGGSGTRPQTRYSYTQRQAWYDTGSGVVASGLPVYMPTGVSTCQTGAAPACVSTADEVATAVSYGPATGANNLEATSVATGAGDASLTATTAMTWDARGNLETVDGPLSGSADTTRYRYDSERRRVGVIGPDPDGGGSLKHRAVRTTYDARGRVTAVARGTVDSQSDPDWAAFAALETVGTTYDTGSRPVRQTLTGSDSNIHTVTDASYDAANRLICTTTRMNPSAWGTLTAACTAQGTGGGGPDRITRNSYDAANQLTLVETGYGTGDAADEVAATYTDNGQTETVTDAEGNRTTYVYDGHDRLSRTRMPDPSTAGTSSTTDYEELTYDDNGNVTNRRLRDGTSIALTYDDLNRLTGYDIPNVAAWDTDLAFGYDLLGRGTSASDSNGHAFTFAYDALGRLLSETSNWYGAVAASQYDLAGRRTRLTWRDGFYVAYDYDAVGAMVAVRENGASSGAGVLATYAYDDLGRRVSLTRGNGTVTSYGYDAVSRLDELTQDFAGTGDDVTTTFGHDPASGITSLTRSNDAFAFAQANASITDTHNGLNQIVTTGATNVSHDARGNTSAIGAANYVYAADNRLLTAPATTFAYDPLMRLFGESGEGLIFHSDGQHLIMESDQATNTIQRRYVFGPGVDEPLVWYEGSGTSDRRWLHADERGSIVAVSDGSGNVTQVNSYDEYGVPASGNAGRFGYTGQVWLPQAGMWYYKARMYSPSLGRFMQTDPIGYDGGMNLYAYVLNDPINYSDPLGFQAYCLGANCDGDTPVVTGPSRRDPGPNGPSGPTNRCVIRPLAGFQVSGCGASETGSASSAGSSESSCSFRPLDPYDRRTLARILSDPDVLAAMISAWAYTLRTGNEAGFFVYRIGDDYQAGYIRTGNERSVDLDRIYRFGDPAFGGTRLIPALEFHTHSGSYPSAGYPSVQDSMNAIRRGTISLIMTRFGERYGRRC